MIIIITGDIGSGKSCTLTRYALIKLLQGQHVYTNFSLKNLPKEVKDRYHALEFKHLDDFEYWKRQFNSTGFTILLDEFHNVADSRRSASRRNVKVTQFLAQIRKVLKGHTNNHLLVCTQYLRQVDIRTRDLAQYYIRCRFKKGTTTEDDLVIQEHHVKNQDGDFRYSKRTYFKASKTYEYFDTHELIDFGKEEGYVG